MSLKYEKFQTILISFASSSDSTLQGIKFDLIAKNETIIILVCLILFMCLVVKTIHPYSQYRLSFYKH